MDSQAGVNGCQSGVDWCCGRLRLPDHSMIGAVALEAVARRPVLMLVLNRRKRRVNVRVRTRTFVVGQRSIAPTRHRTSVVAPKRSSADRKADLQRLTSEAATSSLEGDLLMEW